MEVPFILSFFTFTGKNGRNCIDYRGNFRYWEGLRYPAFKGKEVYPNGNVYCASKFAVEGLTIGMRLDFLKHNIKVGSIAPGLVNTEFSTVRFHGDTNRADQVYAGMQPLLAEDIAEAILFMVTRPPHVNIGDMLVLAGVQGSARDVIRNE